MTDAFDDEAEQSVTIHEYLKEVEDRELEADLVLGGDDGKECTYNSGYMKRQAIFSCLTCTPDGNAGVCTACSLACHDGHQVVELWTKRNFRCDCGNSKFGEFYCKLFANKDVENVENAYNHNFKGSYCTCGRPYPDPDAVEQEEMIQCCLCEDWFHEEHLGLESSDEIPRDDEGEPLYEDFICRACSEVCSFLRLYPEAIWAAGKQQDADIKGNEGKVASEGMPSTRGSEKSTSDACSHSSPETEDLKVKAHETGDSEVKADSESVAGGKDPLQRENCAISADLNPGTKDNNLHTNCVLGVDIADAPPSTDSKPMFLCKNWRDALCKCEKCLEYYNQKKIAFLADKEDSIVEYEKIGKQKREEKLQQQEGAELNFFNKLGHVEKVEILKGIEEMKDGLRAFLDSADSSKPITAADIHQFFDDIKNKRRRVE
ncbi:putative E3 ubiquitin-protein ligase UBR7 isoform X2 [Neltuma alba]|uniref:putative E3 ubiquitin-protein ligase UBR7 isoform X2 n=1 Tax=Neltuma alba TaxID=207710 RepID=UPI0010A513B4|nr:putative E3 ubiquitin-protein ligase UBR7 isoform X2 [Prosopis alba]